MNRIGVLYFLILVLADFLQYTRHQGYSKKSSYEAIDELFIYKLI